MWILKLKLNFQNLHGNVMGQINRGFFLSDSNLDAKMLAAFLSVRVPISLYFVPLCIFTSSPQTIAGVTTCPFHSSFPHYLSSNWFAEGPHIYFVFQEWSIAKLSIEYDSEPFGKERDAAIKKLASEAGVEVIVRISHTLYDLDK